MYHTPERPKEPRPTEPAAIPPPGLAFRALDDGPSKPPSRLADTYTWECPCCHQVDVVKSNRDVSAPLVQLWHEYRDEECEAFDLYFPRHENPDSEGTIGWEEYKAIFSRFPSFPAWLRARGHLG